MGNTIRRTGWQEDRDGVPFIWKDPDSTLYYTITVIIKSTSLTTNPIWEANGVTISNDSFVLTGTSLALTLQIAKTGQAVVSFTDTTGNKERLTFRWKTRER